MSTCLPIPIKSWYQGLQEHQRDHDECADRVHALADEVGRPLRRGPGQLSPRGRPSEAHQRDEAGDRGEGD